MAAVTSINLQISRLKNLPELPAASLNIIKAVSDPEISIEELNRIISISPVLVARLLGLANSAYFGCSGQINDLKTAIIRVLGLNLVKSLTLGILLNLTLETSKCRNFKSEKLWMNALMTATLAQKFSQLNQDKALAPSTCYTAGLLLGIGLIAAVHLFPEATDQVLMNAEQNSSSISEEMISLTGHHHYEIGGLLLEHWRLPIIYQVVLKEFKNPHYSGEETRLIVLLSLCHEIAKSILSDQEEIASLIVRLETFGLPAAATQQIISEIQAKKESIYLAALAISGK